MTKLYFLRFLLDTFIIRPSSYLFYRFRNYVIAFCVAVIIAFILLLILGCAPMRRVHTLYVGYDEKYIIYTPTNNNKYLIFEVEGPGFID